MPEGGFSLLKKLPFLGLPKGAMHGEIGVVGGEVTFLLRKDYNSHTYIGNIEHF